MYGISLLFLSFEWLYSEKMFVNNDGYVSMLYSELWLIHSSMFIPQCHDMV